MPLPTTPADRRFAAQLSDLFYHVHRARDAAAVILSSDEAADDKNYEEIVQHVGTAERLLGWIDDFIQGYSIGWRAQQDALQKAARHGLVELDAVDQVTHLGLAGQPVPAGLLEEARQMLGYPHPDAPTVVEG